MHDALTKDYALPCIGVIKDGEPQRTPADLVGRVGCSEAVRRRV